MSEKKIKGKIDAVEDMGTILQLSVDCGNGTCETIPIDHRMYHRMLEDEHFIIGREIEYQDGSIYFLDPEGGDDLE